ncbi:MAG: ATP-dependent RecD-like DNA helicase [Burkholderiales bacterium]|nr:ATP-dependent RecD-like DNA helicase [Burkholderiales bacterium]
MNAPDLGLSRLEGLIERVTYHNPENGFCVLRIKVKGERELLTLIGNASSVTPGEYVNAQGIWVNDKDHGRQFKAIQMEVVPPTTLAGIEKYLGSGMVKGIGPVYASRIVKAFGLQVFDIIDQDPNRLSEVEGIGPIRKKKIIKGWADQKVIREIMTFLYSHGVSTSKAVRIFKTYGTEAVEVVKQNPYRLAKDIRGIGFKTADTIALKVGIPENSPLRAAAGLTYALQEAADNDGHCCLTRTDLKKLATELLHISESVLDEALQNELKQNNIIEDKYPEQGSIYQPYLYYAESSIAENIRRIRASPIPWKSIDASIAIPWVEEKLHIKLSNSQKEATRQAVASKLLVITGGPGVGKTTLIKSILRILGARKIKMMLCAPTGRAAKRLSESTGREAKTIHRLLEIDPTNGKFKRNEESPLDCDLLVIDEASMVDVQLASSLLKAVHRRTAVIIVGDIDQLPSVGPGAFLSDLINSKTVPVIRLTEVFRQAAQSRIIRAAHQINEGKFPWGPKKGEKSDFYILKEDVPEKVSELIVDLVKRRLPQHYGFNSIKDIQVLCPMNRSCTGAFALNEMLKASLNPPTENSVTKFGTTFSPGDKVMQMENNYDRNVYNGDIGYVSKIDREEEELLVNFDGMLVTYPFGELDELVLCYATTVHKSQGSEYPVVILPVTTQHFTMLKKNLLYTGVTRGKKLVILVGQEKAIGIAVHARSGLKRHSGLLQRLRSKNSDSFDLL